MHLDRFSRFLLCYGGIMEDELGTSWAINPTIYCDHILTNCSYEHVPTFSLTYLTFSFHPVTPLCKHFLAACVYVWRLQIKCVRVSVCMCLGFVSC